VAGALRTREQLRRHTARPAIDDVGTGYVSFGYLRDIPIDAVKIDRSFVAGLGRDQTRLAIVRAIAALAHDLELIATAEGIETLEQQAWVQIDRRVEPWIVEWLGIVRGVRVPSAFSRSIAMCSRSRTNRNPRRSNAATTRRFGASTGNGGT
jgi:hypothetical protein